MLAAMPTHVVETSGVNELHRVVNRQPRRSRTRPELLIYIMMSFSGSRVPGTEAGQ